MLIGLPLLLLTVGGVTWLVTRRALRPVEGIRAEMAAITASEDLARRVPEPDTHDEVARLARTTNETLAALEASVERQRAFVADASHELRSPIASLRTQLEVGAAHPELLDLDGAVEDTVRLQRLAADLLLLARLDAGERPPPDARFDLAKVVRDEVASRDGVTLDGRRVRGAAGLAQPDLPRPRQPAGQRPPPRPDRGRRHPAHARRTGRSSRSRDDGAGVPGADRERIFERFVRLDEARARDDGGAGPGPRHRQGHRRAARRHADGRGRPRRRCALRTPAADEGRGELSDQPRSTRGHKTPRSPPTLKRSTGAERYGLPRWPRRCSAIGASDLCSSSSASAGSRSMKCRRTDAT